MRLWRWSVALMQSAPCLSLCARAIAEDRPDVAGVLRGAAYAAYAQASPHAVVTKEGRSATSKANFILAALHETGEIVSAALGDEQRRELRARGAAMTMDEAITYAVTNIDVTTIER
jgi:hypothetical protein